MILIRASICMFYIASLIIASSQIPRFQNRRIDLLKKAIAFGRDDLYDATNFDFPEEILQESLLALLCVDLNFLQSTNPTQILGTDILGSHPIYVSK